MYNFNYCKLRTTFTAKEHIWAFFLSCWAWMALGGFDSVILSDVIGVSCYVIDPRIQTPRCAVLQRFVAHAAEILAHQAFT
jgi:hypothetical protein